MSGVAHRQWQAFLWRKIISDMQQGVANIPVAIK
jgi:hypothetical protein